MTRDPNCKAYQSGSQIFCPDCGLNWDVGDDDPPDCLPEKQKPQPSPKRKPIRDDRHPIGGSL